MEDNRVRILDKLRPAQVRQHFRVPDIGESSLPRNQNLACFLMFLLQVLDDEEQCFSKYFRERLYTSLQKKLTFLHALLGDTPFQCCELQDTMDLFVDFETIANETGSFIYSVVSTTRKKMRKRKFDSRIKALFDKVQMFINEKIKGHCIKELPQASPPKHLPSLFIIGSLLEDLQCLVDGQFDLNLVGIRDQFSTLIHELNFFLPILKNIEKSQVVHSNDEMKESVIHMIDVTYEAEYLVNTHTAGLIPSWYLNLRLPIIVQKIHNAGKRIQEIENMDNIQQTKIQALRYPAEDDESNVVGFEDIRVRILADLVGGSRKLQTIAVIGMSGIGKTTIAKKLFNDRAVGVYFDHQVLCTISQAYEKKKVLDEIWMNLTRKLGKEKMVKCESIELGIYKTLFGRKYLIIMDDVWDSRVWDDMRSCFPENGNGSRILFTSQITQSAPVNVIYHPVPLLSDSQCFKLLMKKVFLNEPCPAELLATSEKIASKCHGLPLTVVVVSGILANVGNEESVWRNIERKMESYLSDDSSIRILELSYKYLPNHLKPCFLTLWWSSARKDVRVRDIIPLWISHGFVEKEENKSQEEIAEEYILELINRSLLSISKRRSDGGIKVCEFHDLINGMCLETSITENFFCDPFLSNMNSSFEFIHTDSSHLSTLSESSNIYSISSPYCRSVSKVKSALGYSVTHMPLLRVNYRQDSPIDEKSVSGLVHLRYLGSHVKIARLPEGISKLVKLEYLVLPYCGIVDVPSSILKMAKLKHIRIEDQVIFLKDCDISKIRSNVRSLSCVRIRNSEDEEILKCTPHLQKLKCICEGLLPDVGSLILLEKLNISVFESPRLKGELTQMKFPSTLSKVTLSGTNLPWEESSALGRLPNLQVLKLLYDAFCGKEWETRDDEFQELRYLKIHNVLSLRQWTSYSEHFPKLRKLVLGHVRVDIPVDLGNISTLESIEVYNCVKETNESANLIREEQVEEYENENLKIVIRDTSSNHVLVEEEKEVSALPQHEKICAGCNTEYHGGGTNWKGCNWHDECFCCHACKQRINDSMVQSLNGRPYHNSCYKELHHPKCDVCKDYIRLNAARTKYDGLRNQFWGQNYCRSHVNVGTPKCCSCYRFEQIEYLILDDGRALCLECKESSIIMNTEECQPLYMEIRDFFEGLNIKVKQDFPILVVDSEAVKEATKGGIYEGKKCTSNVLYKDRGADLTRIQLPTTTNNDSHVLAILVQYGFPRIVTGYNIAYKIMEAWMSFEEGYQDLSLKVKIGIICVLTYMWFEHETLSISSNKRKHSEFEKKLVEYYKYLIENDPRAVNGDGFREGKKAVDKYGLKHTLDHIRRTGTFPA